MSVWCCNLYGGGGCIKRAEGMEIDNKLRGGFFYRGWVDRWIGKLLIIYRIIWWSQHCASTGFVVM